MKGKKMPAKMPPGMPMMHPGAGMSPGGKVAPRPHFTKNKKKGY